MTLSPAERLIISMLADIHEKLGIRNELNPDLLKSIVWGGHSWALDWEYQSLGCKEDDDAVVKETADILSMWRSIENALGNIPQPDRDELEKDAYPWSIRFGGFDGNNDPHYGVASFMVEDLGRFGERKGGVMNSHSQSELLRYRTMLKRFQAVAPGVHYKLGKKELTEILKGKGQH